MLFVVIEQQVRNSNGNVEAPLCARNSCGWNIWRLSVHFRCKWIVYRVFDSVCGRLSVLFILLLLITRLSMEFFLSLFSSIFVSFSLLFVFRKIDYNQPKLCASATSKRMEIVISTRQTNKTTDNCCYCCYCAIRLSNQAETKFHRLLIFLKKKKSAHTHIRIVDSLSCWSNMIMPSNPRSYKKTTRKCAIWVN